MARQERQAVVIVTPIDMPAAIAQTGRSESELQGFFRRAQRTLDHRLQPAELDTLASTVESFGQLGIGSEALQVRVGIEDKSHKRVPRAEVIEPDKWRPQVAETLAERHRRAAAEPERIDTAIERPEGAKTERDESLEQEIDTTARRVAQESLVHARSITLRKVLDPTYWLGRFVAGSIPTVRDMYLQSNARRKLFGTFFQESLAHQTGLRGKFDRVFVADHGLGTELLINAGEELSLVGNLISAYKGVRKMAGVAIPDVANPYLDNIPGYNPPKNRSGRVKVRDIPEGIADIIAVVPLVPQLITELVVKGVRGLQIDEGVEDAFAERDPQAYLQRHTNLFKARAYGIITMRQES